jgi:hypothetical protein
LAFAIVGDFVSLRETALFGKDETALFGKDVDSRKDA